ncbi:MAG: hypothetical protein WA981_01945 [Glaciecola sp.]
MEEKTTILSHIELIALFITLAIGVLTQFFDTRQEVENENGEKIKIITPAGKVALSFMLISTIIAIVVYAIKQSEESLKNTQQNNLHKLLDDNHTSVVKSFDALKTELKERHVANIFNAEENRKILIHALNQNQEDIIDYQTKIIAQLNNKHLSPQDTIAQVSNITRTATEKLEKTLADAEQKVVKAFYYHYEIAFKNIDLTQCETFKANKSAPDGVYWDIKVNGETFSERSPKDHIKTEDIQGNIIQIDKPYATLISSSIQDNLTFTFSGYVRELTGRSWFNRYYQYRQPNKINSTRLFNSMDTITRDENYQDAVEQVVTKSFTLDEFATDDDNCVLALSGQVRRTVL